MDLLCSRLFHRFTVSRFTVAHSTVAVPSHLLVHLTVHPSRVFDGGSHFALWPGAYTECRQLRLQRSHFFAQGRILVQQLRTRATIVRLLRCSVNTTSRGSSGAATRLRLLKAAPQLHNQCLRAEPLHQVRRDNERYERAEAD